MSDVEAVRIRAHLKTMTKSNHSNQENKKVSSKSSGEKGKLWSERIKKGVEDTERERRHQRALAVVDEKEEKMVIEEDVKEMHEEEFETVVHPWWLHTVSHQILADNKVSLDHKEHGHQVYKIAEYADNLVGKGLFRKEKGTGTFKLSRTWGNKDTIVKACSTLVADAIGKSDVDKKFLIPKAKQLLAQYVTPWPGVDLEIMEWLDSDEFAASVYTYHAKRLETASKILSAKAYKYAASIQATKEEVDIGIQLWTQKDTWESKYYAWSAALACLVAFIGIMLVRVLPFSLLSKIKLYVACVVFSLTVLIPGLYRYWLISPKSWQVYRELNSASLKVNYASLVQVASTCSKGVKLPELLKTWKFKLVAGSQDLACKVKGAYDTFGTFINGASMVIPNGCHHDQHNGLIIRFFYERALSQVAMAKTIKAAVDYCTNMMPVGVWRVRSYDEWVSHLAGKRAKMLLDEPECTSISKYVPVDIFVKLEAYLGKSYTAFKPRIIQGRQLAYQNIVGPFFYSVSKWLGTVFHFSQSKLIYDSGLDAKELGYLACQMFSQYKYVYEIDVSNWDGSLAPAWLKWEIWFIENCLPELPPRWRELRKHWRRVEGNGKQGLHFSTEHGRRSGDMWTSCFNSLINLMILFSIFGKDCMAVAKGDDNFFGTNSSLSVDDIVNRYAAIGMKAKVKRVTHISKLGYCSGKFYPLEDGSWKWGLKPFRILAKLGLNLHRHPAKLHQRLLYGTALSMLPIGAHVPVLGELLQTIVRCGESKNLSAILVDEPWKTTSDTIDPVSASAYNFFTEEYGFDIDDLDDLEFMCKYNVNEHRLISIEDFPIVFEDSRFLKGFVIDCDVDEVSDNANIHFEHKHVHQHSAESTNNWYDFWLNVVFAPLWEELMRACSPILFTSFIALAETVLTGSALHLSLHCFFLIVYKSFGFWAVYACHTIWNFSVWLLGLNESKPSRLAVNYGSLIAHAERMRLTHARRVAGLFSPIPDCAATIINRLTGIPHRLSGVWCPSVERQEIITKKVQNQNKKKPNGKQGAVTPQMLQAMGQRLRPVKGNVGKSIGGIPLLRGILDPFDPSATGQKVPDKCAFPSVTFTLQTISRRTVDSNGRHAVAVLPQGKFHLIGAAQVASVYSQPYDWTTTANLSYADATNWSSYANNFSAYRVVSGGIKIKCDGSINNMTGRVYVVDVPLVSNTYANGLDFYPTTLAQACQNPSLVREFTMMELMQDGVVGSFRRTDEQSEHYVWEGYPATVGTAAPAGAIFNTRGWCAKVIILEGLPASANCIELHSILNIEAIGTPIDAVVSASPAAPPAPAVTHAMYSVAQYLPPANTLGDGWFEDLSSGISKAIGIGTQLVGAYEKFAPMLSTLLL